MKRYFVFIPLLILICGSIMVSASQVVTIRVSERSNVSGQLIRLGDIADISGEDSVMVERLRSLLIGRSPGVGKSRRISKDIIEASLKRKKIDLSLLHIELPDEIIVTREYVTISGEEIRNIVKEFIYKSLTVDRDCIRINKIDYDDDLLLPKGGLTFEVIPLGDPAGRDYTTLSVILSVDREVQKKIRINVDIEVLRDVVLCNHSLRANDVVSEEDVIIEKRYIKGVDPDIFSNISDVVGKKLRRSIRSGEIFRDEMLKSLPLLKKGDMVSIVAESDNVRVTTIGRAEEDGEKGKMIMIRNLVSNKVVYGLVVDSRTVKVAF
ncbi:MAG: flagellar basal body P-ring formation protein FlgA [Nitrospinae bacterium]|nr:flagellar basal body P-ring formation protein FlgA [Nitrospinota bacterium]